VTVAARGGREAMAIIVRLQSEQRLREDTMREGKLAVAIQGAGWVSTEHIRAYLRNPRVQVVAIGSRTREGAQRKAQELELDVPCVDTMADLLAQPGLDAVSICTPPQRHSEETIQAARAGKHILIEKPVAVTFDELHRMDEAVREAGVRTVVSFVLHWNPAVQNIKALQAAGMLGTSFYVQTDYWHNLEQAGLLGHGGGVSAMLAGGCHAMDMARHLMESDVVEVTALGWSPEAGSASGEEHPGMANTVALVRFADGRMGKVSGCTSQWMPYQFNIDLFGTDGVVRGNRLYTRQLPGLTDLAELPTILPDRGDVAHHPFRQEIDHFVDCVLNNRESPVSLHDAVNTHEACFAADRSAAESGRPIKLPLTS
jgi:predicted dehydrogenase